MPKYGNFWMECFEWQNFDDELTTVSNSKTIVVSTSALSTGPDFVVFERNKGNRRDSDSQQNSTEKAPAVEFASTSSRWIRGCSWGYRFLSGRGSWHSCCRRFSSSRAENVTKEGNVVFCTLSLFFYVNVPESFFVILTNKIVLRDHLCYKACYKNNFSFPLFLWVSLTNDSLVLFA